MDSNEKVSSISGKGGLESPAGGVRSISIMIEERRRKAGLTVPKAAFFMVAQMAGAGFLALPRAMADAGWLGLVMMFLFCLSSGYSAIKLGLSWVILEERYPEYRKPARQPYVEVAYRSLGPIGRKVAMILMMVANIGSSTVFIILIAELINSIFEQLSICEFAMIVVAALIPLAWMGTPKDFWQASVFAVVSTLLAVIIIIVEIFINYQGVPTYPVPGHPYPTAPSFSLGFGAILFSFGGMSVFPTIQNDMKDRSQFWKSVLVSFSIVFTMYFPVALFGYIYIGDTVNSNVILSLESSPVIIVAIIFQIFNLMGTFIITLSPVFQCLEDIFGFPRIFGIKRILMRTTLVLCELLIALGFPDFGLIVNLIGGSAMSCLSFILPPLMYMKLIADKSNKDWIERHIPTWEKVYLWEICFVGVVGGLASTVSSLYALLRPESFEKSCFVQFGPAPE